MAQEAWTGEQGQFFVTLVPHTGLTITTVFFLLNCMKGFHRDISVHGFNVQKLIKFTPSVTRS
jgi:hypothetical protein